LVGAEKHDGWIEREHAATASSSLLRSAQRILRESRGREFEDDPMPCKSCSLGNLRNSPTKIAVHLKVIGRPHVFVFPQILVRLNCGFTELVIEIN
jgi:hypothetical protein